MADRLAAIEAAMNDAVRTGAVVRYRAELEQGELDQRSLWLRPEVNDLLNFKLEPEQRDRVRALETLRDWWPVHCGESQ
jgi:hypothetical protein